MASKSRPAKRTKLLSDDSGSDSEGAGVPLPKANNANSFNINQEYANRFEHNKRREEKQRLEEKYATGANASKRKAGPDNIEEEDESSSDETEDDDAELATADLDEEIFDTLNAIKRKDPRVYNQDVRFYRDWENEDNADANGPAKKKEKPMRLQDYHRQNLLAGHAGDEEEGNAPPQTYQQEQDALRKEMVGQMHAAGPKGEEEESFEEGSDADEFFQKKQKQKHDAIPAAKSRKKQSRELDIENADKDPENYLSNFMAARAWLPTDHSQFAQLDSDDSEEDKRADAFEEAYNMRFEDPRMANERLQTFARDVGKHTARREEASSRQKARERDRAKKEEAKKEREEERARLRKLRIDDVEQKVSKIKEAAGLKGKDVNLEQWRDVLDEDWDDARWEAEMKRRFGEDYYAQDEAGSDVEMGGVEEGGKKHKKMKKPKWDDDLDITDLVPDFQDEEPKPNMALSSDDEADGGAPVESPEEEESRPRKKSKKDRERETTEKKRSARKERQKIEQLVDATMPLAHPEVSAAASSGKAPVTGFRYRETSPTSFGMNARDILFADDTALNEYAGLKKLAAWRDSEKKKRDKKRFSKKQRLRQWRKDTFGDVEGPKNAVLPGGEGEADERMQSRPEQAEGGVVDGERKKKRKRSKKSKTGAEAA
ncbi:hypothetical protein MBLNU230_g0201t1 [Neophaeotheca triangularis]